MSGSMDAVYEEFHKELEDIKDEKIRLLTCECLNRAPVHFWYMSASSTGKYHARDENESRGLVLHTHRVAQVAEHIIESWPNPINTDVIRSACLLHDAHRYGSQVAPSKWSNTNHPKLAADFIQKIAKETFWQKEITTISEAQKIDHISVCVASHMGKWGQYPVGSQESLIVHLADALATNVYMDMDKERDGKETM